jgi:hypothetical protein
MKEKASKSNHVVVVGLIGQQPAEVERRYQSDHKDPTKLRLTFIDKDRSRTKFAGDVDWVVISRFAPHRWSERARQEFPRERVRFVRGGVGRIAQTILGLAE